jgi:hypothetical protein
MELKLLFYSGVRLEEKPANPLLNPIAFMGKNFRKNSESGNFEFDLLDNFDYIRTQEDETHVTYDRYRNENITSAKIDIDRYRNEYESNYIEIFVKVADIRRVQVGDVTRIFCDTSKLNDNNIVMFRHTDIHDIVTQEDLLILAIPIMKQELSIKRAS